MKFQQAGLFVLLAVIGLGLYCAGVSKGKSKVQTQLIVLHDSAMVARLNQAEASNDSLRRRTVKRDTLWRRDVQEIQAEIPKVIASVDSLACAPVSKLLTRCGKSLDSALAISNGLQAVILADSVNLRGERGRADSTIKSLLKLHPSRWGCTMGPTAGLDLAGKGFVGGGVTCGLRL